MIDPDARLGFGYGAPAVKHTPCALTQIRLRFFAQPAAFSCTITSGRLSR
jgi:hypothetical protein